MSNPAPKYHVITPDEEEIELARQGLDFLTKGENANFERMFADLLQSSHVREALVALLEEMGNSGEVAIASTDKTLTSQEAADFLGVSRPHLTKLLDSEIIPSHKTGAHRRVYFRDILQYRQKRDNMSKGLDALSRQAQEHKLGWN